MWRPTATIRRQSSGHLGDSELVQRGFHDHFAGEFHPGRTQVELRHGSLTKTAQPAVEIAARTLKEEPPDCSEHGVAEISVRRRHGSGFDTALEAISHYQIVAGAQFFNEGKQVGKVVTVVGVTHDDILASGRSYATHQRIPIAFGGNLNYTRAQILGQCLGAIGAAVIGNDNLTGYVILA